MVRKSTVKTVTMHKAKTTLSQLVAEVEEGGEYLLLRGTVPVARLIGLGPVAERRFGVLKGLLSVGPAFFEPLPESELKRWES